MKADVIITGAAGFIASCLAQFCQKQGLDILIVDDFSHTTKTRNTSSFEPKIFIDRDYFLENINNFDCKTLIHLGARTDTTELNYAIHEKLNLAYSKIVWEYCTSKDIHLIYASSAATYGNGEFGYTDDHTLIQKLVPLNPYGVSKNEFDKFALQSDLSPKRWQGLKFFNVFGPNEYHKGRMASVIFHAYHQIKDTKKMKLFKSHHPDFEDGMQQRDFIYVKDLIQIIWWLVQNKASNGIYNVGTGHASSFNDLAINVFKELSIPAQIDYIDTPEDIRENYQYFTQASMEKLFKEGYNIPFFTFEEAIHDYIQDYLIPDNMY